MVLVIRGVLFTDTGEGTGGYRLFKPPARHTWDRGGSRHTIMPQRRETEPIIGETGASLYDVVITWKSIGEGGGIAQTACPRGFRKRGNGTGESIRRTVQYACSTGTSPGLCGDDKRLWRLG